MGADSESPTIHDLLCHAAWLRGLVEDLLRAGADADDVVQKTWLRALRRPPRAWLARVARTVLLALPRPGAHALKTLPGGVLVTTTTKVLVTTVAVATLAAGAAVTGIFSTSPAAAPAPAPPVGVAAIEPGSSGDPPAPPPPESDPVAVASAPPPAPAGPAAEELSGLEIRKRLDETSVTLRAENVRLDELLSLLAREVGVPICLDPEAEDRGGRAVSVNFEETPAQDVVRFLCALHGLSHRIVPGGVRLGPPRRGPSPSTARPASGSAALTGPPSRVRSPGASPGRRSG